ncbi:hypothetical protein D1AOALGA4SA_3809 [Olavius algarvensis Delta 1 endosymbiont]|nr:hypothetical protein D1AOALGA4SA_3809 [Olavius algarvensis Delta 1 endosymbiont]
MGIEHLKCCLFQMICYLFQLICSTTSCCFLEINPLFF